MTDYPWMFTEEAKMRYINEAIRKEQFNKEQQTFEIEVDLRNDNIIKTVQTIFDPDNFNWKLKLPLVVRDCSGEIDAGGLQREFFRNVEIDSISKETPIFKECLNKYYWFNEDFNDYKMIEVIGTIFGCMIINHWHLGYSFPLFFYEKLLYDDPPEIVVMPDDKSSDDGIIKSSLEHADSEEDINRHNENSESSDCTEFTNDEDNSSSSEKNGSEGEISESEKMSEKGKMQLDAFITGFRKIRENCIIECFDPKELKQLMESSKVEKNEKYDF